MRRAAAAMLIVLAAACFPIATGLAQQVQSIEQLYQSLRDDAFADYQKSLGLAEEERQRKIREQLPPSTPKQHAQGAYLVKFILYNKVIFYVICAEGIDRNLPAEKGAVMVKQCVAEKTEEMMKYLKLGDYAGTIGVKRFVGCEIRSRDFRREQRFPLFDFLRDAKGPEIIDFAVANECITAGL